MEYQFIHISASKMASATFLWSLLHFGQDWVRIFGTFLGEFHNFQKFDHIVLEHIPGIPHLIQKRRTASNCRTVEHCRPAGAPTKTEDYL